MEQWEIPQYGGFHGKIIYKTEVLIGQFPMNGGYDGKIHLSTKVFIGQSSIKSWIFMDFHGFSIFSIAMLASPKGKPMAQRHSELRRHEDEIRRELQKYPEHGWFTAVPKRYETGMGRKYTYRISKNII